MTEEENVKPETCARSKALGAIYGVIELPSGVPIYAGVRLKEAMITYALICCSIMTVVGFLCREATL